MALSLFQAPTQVVAKKIIITEFNVESIIPTGQACEFVIDAVSQMDSGDYKLQCSVKDEHITYLATAFSKKSLTGTVVLSNTGRFSGGYVKWGVTEIEPVKPAKKTK